MRHSTVRRRGALALTLAAAAASCVHTTTHHPVGSGAGATLHAVPLVSSWDVVERGRTVGAVLRFEAPPHATVDGSFHYIVRNEHGQDLGFVDSMGRAWRRRPHAEDEALGAGTLVSGARRILGVGDAARLAPREAGLVALDSAVIAAAYPRSRR